MTCVCASRGRGSTRCGRSTGGRSGHEGRMPSLTLQAPLDGWCAPLSEVPDAVFADGMIGDGMAIDPTSGALLAPCEGEVVTLASGGHAVSVRAAPGVDVLVHLGIDS